MIRTLLFVLCSAAVSAQTLTNADLGNKFNRPPADVSVYASLKTREYHAPHVYPLRMPERPSTGALTPWEWPQPSNVVRLDGSPFFLPPVTYGGWRSSFFPITGIYGGRVPHSGSEGAHRKGRR